ncbi:MAG: acyltransferase [Bacteroidota bacterium]
MGYFKHIHSDVQSEKIGDDTRIWQYAVVLAGAQIGSNCNINCHTFIENDVIIGNNVTVKSGVYVWDGIRVEDDVFIGPNVTFVNDKFPRSKRYPPSFNGTHIQQGASLGAGAIILGGISLGRYAMVGAGAVVTKDVPDFALVYGNPAIIKGWVNESGEVLQKIHENEFTDEQGHVYQVIDGKLLKKP